jgi:hypothetical protein
VTAWRISFILALLGAGVLAAQGTVVAHGEGFVLGADEVMAAGAAAPREVRASLSLKDDGIQEFFLDYLRVALLAHEARLAELDRDPVVRERVAAAARAVLAHVLANLDPYLSVTEQGDAGFAYADWRGWTGRLVLDGPVLMVNVPAEP